MVFDEHARLEEYTRLFKALSAQNLPGHALTDAQIAQLQALCDRMLAVNKTMNLTAITDERDVMLLHFIDSLTVSPLIPEGARLADVGCGAGFPCLPLAITRPDLSILALDSTEKRIRYVRETAHALALDNLAALAARAEEAGQGELRESFDAVTARAVAALPLLCELCLPLVRVGGRFIAMKAKRGEEELQASLKAIERLGGKLIAKHAVTLTDGEREESRLLIEIQKLRPTPRDLPRPWAKMLKKPL